MMTCELPKDQRLTTATECPLALSASIQTPPENPFSICNSSGLGNWVASLADDSTVETRLPSAGPCAGQAGYAEFENWFGAGRRPQEFPLLQGTLAPEKPCRN